MEKQIIEILGFRVMEPGTLISDLVLAIASLFFFRVLRRIAQSKYQNYYSFFFLFIGISGITGAFAHALFLYTGKSLHFISWVATSIAVYYFELGISLTINNRKIKDLFVLFVKFQLALCVLLTCYYASFMVVKINMAIGLLGIVFPVILTNYIKNAEKSNLFILLGIAMAIIPALLHKIKISVSVFFNMNDISHFFLVFCLLSIFIGLRKSIKNYNMLSQEVLA